MILDIDLVSDFVCPWCFLGKVRLDRALAELRVSRPDLDVRVAVANLAVSYNWEFLLEDACIRGEPDDGLRSHLERLLDGVNPPPECSESGVSLRFLEWVPEAGDPSLDREDGDG